MRLLEWYRARRASARIHLIARQELDVLFRDPARLSAARLRPDQRSRATILEVERGPDGRAARIVFGIIRHPKAHPLAGRGEEVLELIEYRPPGGIPSVLAGRNLTRRGKGP